MDKLTLREAYILYKQMEELKLDSDELAQKINEDLEIEIPPTSKFMENLYKSIQEASIDKKVDCIELLTYPEKLSPADIEKLNLGSLQYSVLHIYLNFPPSDKAKSVLRKNQLLVNSQDSLTDEGRIQAEKLLYSPEASNGPG